MKKVHCLSNVTFLQRNFLFQGTNYLFGKSIKEIPSILVTVAAFFSSNFGRKALSTSCQIFAAEEFRADDAEL